MKVRQPCCHCRCILKTSRRQKDKGQKIRIKRSKELGLFLLLKQVFSFTRGIASYSNENCDKHGSVSSALKSLVNRNLSIAFPITVLYPEFFGHTGTCTGTGTLTKVLESTLPDRQTDKSYGSI